MPTGFELTLQDMPWYPLEMHAFLASSVESLEALKAVGDFEPHDCPAALVKAGTTTWYVDKASLADYTPKWDG